MLEVEQARKQILASASVLSDDKDTQCIDIYQAHQRILAADITADIDVPPADNSAMDGYAVALADLKDIDAEHGVNLPVSQRIPAGSQAKPLEPGSAARIFTGSEIPPGADAVVMQENCQTDNDHSVRILKAAKVAENIRPRGQDILKGSRIATKGQALTPQRVGLLASVGAAKVTIFRPLRVALLATGNELVEPGRTLDKGQIYNSNQAMLHQWLISLGCEIVSKQIVEDTLKGTVAALSTCDKQADLVISSGGVSVGEEDHIKAAMAALGELHLWKVAMKPGKPLAFGKLKNAMFLGLPGNPVSSFVTFLLFGVPLIKHMRGEHGVEPSRFFLPANFSSKTQSRREYCRVQIKNGRLEKFPNQSSGVLTSVCWADALACIPQNTEVIKGDLLEVLPFQGHLN